MSIFESSRKMTHKEQIAFDLGYKKGQHDAVKHGELLTLEDLKQMAGQPVWVEVIDHKMFADKEDDFDGWGLVRSSWVRLWDESRADIVHVDYDFEEYGKTWRAYSAPVKHGKWIHTDKHFFKKGEDGCVDEWTFDYDFHNGVYCEICGRSICVHCDPDWENDKCKKGHYICSECGSHEKENRDYCPNCGARMDGEQMARAVDADIFIRDLTAMKKMYDAIELDGMIKALKEAPTIDPVKHGKWTRSYETGSQDYDTMRNIRYRCSECNKKAMWDTEYCPHCGSRMDGE